MPAPKTSPFLKPEVIASLTNIELIAKLVVEGYLTGLHKSPFHGFSVEFSQHRPYMPGDSLRFIDWKVFGRTDRYYIKQFEEETNLRSYLLLDISRSMDFGRPLSKGRYAAYLAAAIAHVLLRQRDAVGLALFDNKIRKILPPRSVLSYSKPILSALDQLTYGPDTNIAAVLHEIADRFRRRGLVIVISDLLDEPDKILKGLKHFRHNQHEVLVFHILDRQEVSFSFKGDMEFEDLESGEKLKTQPVFIRKAYQERVNDFLDQIRTNCRNNRIDYQQLFTDTPFNIALTQYLIKRKKLH